MATKAEHITAAEQALARAEAERSRWPAGWTLRDDIAEAAVHAALAQVTV
ncbi:MAG: hypothetical protein WAW17_02575 [Rhodococcus sp. (in: high G+C Gram-positive bacteria)]